MHLFLQRLVIKEVCVRRRTIHEEINHPLGLGRKVRQSPQPTESPTRLWGTQSVPGQQRGQGRGANARCRPAKKLAAIDHELVFSDGMTGLIHG